MLILGILPPEFSIRERKNYFFNDSKHELGFGFYTVETMTTTLLPYRSLPHPRVGKRHLMLCLYFYLNLPPPPTPWAVVFTLYPLQWVPCRAPVGPVLLASTAGAAPKPQSSCPLQSDRDSPYHAFPSKCRSFWGGKAPFGFGDCSSFAIFFLISWA